MGKSKQLIFTTAGEKVTKNLSDLPELRKNDDIVPVKIYESYENSTVSKEFTLPSKIFHSGDDLMVDLHFLDKDGIRKSKEKIGLKTGKERYDLTDPRVPPVVSAKLSENNSDMINYTITQKDPYAESVSIYYRLFTPGLSYFNEDTEYKFLKNVNVVKDQTVYGQSIVRNFKGQIVILRFISQSIFNRLGAFRDVIVLQEKKSEATNRSDIQSTFKSISGSIICDVSYHGIRVKLLNVSMIGFSSLVLCRKTIQKSELGTVREYNVNYFDLGNQTEFFDPVSGLQSDRFYEYTLYGSNAGNLQTAEGLRVLTYFKEQAPWFSCGVNHRQKSTEGGQAHKFLMLAEIQSNESSIFFNFLKKHKMEDLYSEDLDSIKSKIQQFFLYSVTKRNLLTGDVNFLGYHLPMTELEDKTSNRPVLRCNHSHAYIFKLYTGNPSDIIASLNSQTLTNAPLHTQVTQADIAKDLQKDEPDYASESVFKDGTVRSVRGTAFNPLNLEDTGFTHTHVVSTSKMNFGIGRVTARKTRSGDNAVSWSCSNGKLIDHFIIYSLINGTASIAGVHYNVPGNSSYCFYDTRCREAIGSVKYTVVAVTLDFKLSSTESSSNNLAMT